MLCAKLLQLCLTLCDPMDHSWPDSSIHGILQARILEWVALSFSRGSFPTQRSNLSLLNFLHWQVGSFFFFKWTKSHLFFFSFIYISWRLITLQYCSSFCHTLTWISHGFTCVPHPDPPSHLPPHLIPLGHPSAPALSTCLMPQIWTGDLFHNW